MSDRKDKILVIDANIAERKILSTYLRRENFCIETGRCLKDAVRKMSESCFLCLILDVELPEMKGYEAVSIIKRIDPEIKIIMTSKKNSKSLETRIRKQDIFYYFIKSFEKEELRIAIMNALNRDRRKMTNHETTLSANDIDPDLKECGK